ncbi:Putative 1-phosphatidylinositol-3-phosphate 5-kinase FAB1D, partial [Linum perenne]
YSVARDDFLRSGLTPGVSHLSGLPSDIEEFIAVEARKLHIVIKDGIVVRDYKDEVSSLIACVVAHGRTIERGSGWPEVMAEPALGCSECVGLKFGDDSVVSVATLHEERFKELRRRAHLAELEYITSLSRCARWDAKGGKSNAVFAKTRDEKLIVKEIQKVEFNSFNWFAEKYIEYMLEGRPGCLAKIFGLYKVKGVGRTRYLIVMENIQFGRQFSKRYDVKGLVYKRSANEDSDEVLLDENFARLMTSCRVSKDTKDKLTIAVKNDADFLTSVGVMDYSLLIGVNKEEFAYGIIDYLRQYTFDKGLETIFKFVCVVPWGQRPTIIPPAKYSSRLQCFLSDHFRTT